jgi:hypothetical protein
VGAPRITRHGGAALAHPTDCLWFAASARDKMSTKQEVASI